MAVRIIVCCGRHFSDRRAVFRVLDHIHTYRSVAAVIQGECPTGADRWARESTVGYGLELIRCYADSANAPAQSAIDRCWSTALTGLSHSRVGTVRLI